MELQQQLELKNMVQITIQADNGITHKVWEKEGNAFNDDPGVLRYYFYGPGGNPSKRNESFAPSLKHIPSTRKVS